MAGSGGETSTTATKTIEVLRRMFSTYGLPEQLVSDNVPLFVAEELAQFMSTNGVKHIRVSPYHPSSNDAAEHFVQTLKKAMRADARRGTPLQQSLANFLLTLLPSMRHATTNEAPCDLFLKRSLRTRLDLLSPDCGGKVFEKQTKQKACHDQHCKHRELSLGQNVNGSKLLRRFSLGESLQKGVDQ